MNSFASAALRLPIALLVLLGLVVQALLLPLTASALVSGYPELGWVVVPYLVMGILTVLCGQVVMVAIWALLAMVEDGRIFSGRALVWVDIIIGAGVVATLLVLLVAGHLWFVVGQGAPPGIGFGLVAGIVAGTGFVLLMVVMRGLLRTATTMRVELSAVV